MLPTQSHGICMFPYFTSINLLPFKAVLSINYLSFSCDPLKSKVQPTHVGRDINTSDKARLSLISYIRVQMPSLSISASLHSPLHADALSFMVSTKWVSSGLDYSACLSPCGTHEGCWLDEEAFCFKPSCLSTYHFGHTDPSWRSCISYISSGTEQVLKLGHVRLPRPPSPFYPSSFPFHDFRRSYSFFHCSMDLVSWGVVCHPLLSWTAILY